jgi:hypothetical protein
MTLSARVAAAPRGGRSWRFGGELSTQTSATGGRRYGYGTAALHHLVSSPAVSVTHREANA